MGKKRHSNVKSGVKNLTSTLRFKENDGDDHKSSRMPVIDKQLPAEMEANKPQKMDSKTPSTQMSGSSPSSSRQSMTSSTVSIVTETEERSVDAEIEPGFLGRWKDETEMDKSLNILKRKQAATVRLRKMNDVYNRLLEDKLRCLDNNFTHVARELSKEKRFIQEEIKDYRPVLRLPSIDSATPVDSRSASRLSCRSQTDRICQSCLFDSTNTSSRCRHFPCFLPVTYNSIGFTTKPVTYSVVGNYHQLLQRCRDVRPATSKTNQTTDITEHNIDDQSHPPRTTVKEKIRGLKQLVKEMKERNEKTKPRDWAVNYGDPMPRRIILKPVKSV